MIELNIEAADAVESQARFTIERSALHPALVFLASRIVERRKSVPILANLLIEAEPSGCVRFTATDLDIFASVTLDAIEVAEPGRFTVGAAALRDAVKGAKRDATVRLAYAPETAREFGGTIPARVELVHGRARLNLTALPAEEFPQLARAFGDAVAVDSADALTPIGEMIAPDKLAKVLSAAGKLIGDAAMTRAPYQGNDGAAVMLEAGVVRIVAKYAEPQAEMYGSYSRTPAASPFKFGHNADAKAKAREYLFGLRDRYALPVIEGGALIERDGAAIGMTFGEEVEPRTWESSRYETVEIPCYETFTIKTEGRYIVEPTRPAQWSDGAYSVFAPRCNDLVTAEVTCEVDGTLHPIGVHETRHTIQPSAEQVSAWCGPVDPLQRVEIAARWYTPKPTKAERAAMDALARRCNDVGAARELSTMAARFARRPVAPVVEAAPAHRLQNTSPDETRLAIYAKHGVYPEATAAKPRVRVRCIAEPIDAAPIAEPVGNEPLSAETTVVMVGPWQGARAMLAERDARDVAKVALERARRLRIVRAYLRVRHERDVARHGHASALRYTGIIEARETSALRGWEKSGEEKRELTVKRRRAVMLARSLRNRLNAEYRQVDRYIAELSEARSAARVIVDRDIAGNDVNRPDMLNLVERRAVAAEERATTLAARVDQLEQSAVETFARNRPVYDALEEWTGRALRAESALKRPALPAPNVIRVDFAQPARLAA